MTQDLFGQTIFGQLALKKMAPLPEGFLLYRAEWLGKFPEWREMELTGRVFRAPASGPRKGEPCIPVPGTIRSVIVSVDEVRSVEPAAASGQS